VGLFTRVGWSALVVSLVLVTSTAGCGNAPTPVERGAAEKVSLPAANPAPRSALPAPVPLAAATATCSPLKGHAAYGAQSCESCHPCGTKASTGHPTGWLDTASPGFHAYSANAGIAGCQGCHGPALDGVGGSATTSCAK